MLPDFTLTPVNFVLQIVLIGVLSGCLLQMLYFRPFVLKKMPPFLIICSKMCTQKQINVFNSSRVPLHNQVLTHTSQSHCVACGWKHAHLANPAHGLDPPESGSVIRDGKGSIK